MQNLAETKRQNNYVRFFRCWTMSCATSTASTGPSTRCLPRAHACSATSTCTSACPPVLCGSCGDHAVPCQPVARWPGISALSCRWHHHHITTCGEQHACRLCLPFFLPGGCVCMQQALHLQSPPLHGPALSCSLVPGHKVRRNCVRFN